MANIEIFNNIRFEYSVGANVIMFSLIDTSIDKSILVSKNVGKIRIQYSYNGQTFNKEASLNFHINSIIIIIDDLPALTEITIVPYIIYYVYHKEHKVQLTDPIIETTLAYGNISYNLIATENTSNDLIVKNKIEEVLRYINKLGAYVNNSYNSYAQYAKTIPIKYNPEEQTASAYYYKSNVQGNYGLVQTSGGNYCTNHVLFHELRHRYGITSAMYSHLSREKSVDHSQIFNYIESKYSILHDALKFESGREDAKVWVFDAHSNILEGNYTDDAEMNYLAANYLKALIWYTSHDYDAGDNSKVRKIAQLNIQEISNVEPSHQEEIEVDDGTNKCYLSTLIKPYIVDNNEKIFLLSNLYSNGYINKSLNLTLYPYDNINNNIYSNSDINPITTSIIDNIDFRLESKLGFDNNIISILNSFEFPGKIHKDDNYYNVDIHGKLDNNEYEDKYVNQVTKYYNSFYINENISDLFDEEGKLIQDEFREELDIEEIRSTGYIIQIANDINFNEIIFESKINTDNQNNNFIYDFSFSLDNIVNDWKQLNDILVIRSKFIDKRLNIIITGNNVVLTKEWFKYLINDIKVDHILFENQNNLITSDFMNINKGFNLIDKLNCIIVDKKETNIDSSNTNTGSTKIIYKPVFYKVQDLQNIRLRQGVTQNIGINLSEFMNKVDLFILNIDGNNIKESSRNDINVIFNINSNLLENMNGIYNILDNNFEYITSGNYTIY